MRFNWFYSYYAIKLHNLITFGMDFNKIHLMGELYSTIIRVKIWNRELWCEAHSLEIEL